MSAHVCTERCRVVLARGGSRCVFDIVDENPHGLDAAVVAEMLGLTRRGVDWIVDTASRRLAKRLLRAA